MTLKTKISAAAEERYPKHKYADAEEKTECAWFRQGFNEGGNFAIGEVRELLLNCHRALKYYANFEGEITYYEYVGEWPNGGNKECLGAEQIAIEALKKIDDSGVLTDEMVE